MNDLEQSDDVTECFCAHYPELGDTQRCIGCPEYSHILNQEIYVHHCPNNSFCRNLKNLF